jgi:ATP-dependent helicase/DNAse subunit B
MSGKIELHYCSDLYHLTDHFLKKCPPLLETKEQILYIVNDTWRIQQLTNDWLLRKTGDISGEYPFISYSKWLSKLGSQLNIIPRQLKLAERCILLRSVIEQKNQALQYFRFQGTALPADLLRTLVLFFDRIRLNEADADILQEVKDRLILNSSDKLQSDLGMLFSAYLDGQQQFYLDEAGLLTAIIQQLSPEFLRKYYPQLSTIIIEDVSHFQKLHIRFFEHWKTQGIHIIFLLPYGRNPDIFSHKKSLFNRIENIADHVEGYHGVNKLSNSLFQIKAPHFNFRDKIRILPASDRVQEVENLAAQIKKLVTDGHWPFSAIAVSGPQLLSYYSILEMVFNRFKIPCSFSEGRPLEQAFVLKNLGWYIELVKDDYPRNILHKILQSPLFSYRQKLSNPDVLELVPLFRVKSGKKEIQDFLSRQIRWQKMSLKQEDEEERIRLPFDELKEAVDELFLEVRFFEKSQTAGAIYRYLMQIVNRHKFFEKIVDQSRVGSPELSLDNHSALSRFFELLQFWSQLQPKVKYSVQKFWEIF